MKTNKNENCYDIMFIKNKEQNNPINLRVYSRTDKVKELIKRHFPGYKDYFFE